MGLSQHLTLWFIVGRERKWVSWARSFHEGRRAVLAYGVRSHGVCWCSLPGFLLLGANIHGNISCPLGQRRRNTSFWTCMTIDGGLFHSRCPLPSRYHNGWEWGVEDGPAPLAPGKKCAPPSCWGIAPPVLPLPPTLQQIFIWWRGWRRHRWGGWGCCHGGASLGKSGWLCGSSPWVLRGKRDLNGYSGSC